MRLFRSVRKGGSLLTAGALFLGILIMINIASGRAHLRFDWTSENRYTLSPQTRQILSTLKQPIHLIAFLRTDDPNQDELRRLLEEYRASSDRITFDFIDPDRQPVDAQRYALTEYGIVVAGETKYEKARTKTEEGITGAILRLLRPRPVEVVFLAGHGEKSPFDESLDGFAAAARALGTAGYHVRRKTLIAQSAFGDSVDVAVIASPRGDYLPEEQAVLDPWLEGGGRLLVLVDPPPGTQLGGWLTRWGAIVGNDRVIDGSSRGRLVGLDEFTPVVTRYESTPITRGFDLATYYRGSRSVRLPEALPKGDRGWILFRSGAGSWAENDLVTVPPRFEPGADQIGPVPMAVAIDRPASRGARLVVFGDSDFASDRDWRVPGGGDLFLNAVAWLAERPEEIAIRAPARVERRVELNAERARAIFAVGVVGLPLLVALSGVVVAWRRRGL